MASRDETTLDPRTQRLQVIANEALRRLAEEQAECRQLREQRDALAELIDRADFYPDAKTAELEIRRLRDDLGTIAFTAETATVPWAAIHTILVLVRTALEGPS